MVNITNSGDTMVLVSFELRGPTRLIGQWSGNLHAADTRQFNYTLELGGEHMMSLTGEPAGGSAAKEFDPDSCPDLDRLYADFDVTLGRIELSGPDCSAA